MTRIETVGLLMNSKAEFSDRKINQKKYEKEAQSAVNYLQFVVCTLNAAKQNEEP